MLGTGGLAHGALADVPSSRSGNAAGTSAGLGTALAVGLAIFAAVGVAAGVGSASGVGRSTAASSAAASGTGSSSGVGTGIVAAVGSASGSGTATGVGSSINTASASAAGVGSATAVGSGTAASTGSSSGVGAATGVGASTATSTGAASGTGTATGVGRGTAAATGAASGVGSASGVGTSTASAIGSSSGIGSATATTQGTVSGVGTASGVGSALGIGASTATSAGSSAGIGAAAGVGRALQPAAGAAAGSGVASATGSALFIAVGTSSGVGSATGVGTSTAAAVGASSGIGSAAAIGRSTAASAGSSSGVGTAAGVGTSSSVSIGNAAGIGSASGIGRAIDAAVGSAAGVGSASASGIGTGFASSVGFAAGIGTAEGVGRSRSQGALVRAKNNIFLVTLQGHDGVDTQTLRFSAAGVMTVTDDAADAVWFEPRVIDPGNFERHMFSPGRTRGASSVGSGDVVLTSADAGNQSGLTLDYLLDWAFDGRRIIIQSLPKRRSPISAATTLFTGTIEQLVSDNAYEKIAFKIHDRLADLDQPALVNTWMGTTVSGGDGTADGNADLAGQKKQKVFGTARNVGPQVANPFDLVYSFSDGSIVSLQVFDGGLELTNDGDVADLAALLAWTQVPGHYKTCLSLGMARLGSSPTFAVTGNVTEGASAANRTAAELVRKIILNRADLNLGSEILSSDPSDWILTQESAGSGPPYLVTENNMFGFHGMDITIPKEERTAFYRFTGEFKGNGRDVTVWLYNVDDPAAFAYVSVDLSAGVITNVQQGGLFAEHSHSIEDIGGGYFRVTFIGSTDSANSVSVEITTAEELDVWFYAGDGTSGFYYQNLSLVEVLEINETTFSRLNAKNGGECGIVVTGDESVLSACQRVLDSIGGYIVPNRFGLFEVGRLELASLPFNSDFNDDFAKSDSFIDLDESSVIGESLQRVTTSDDGSGLPAWKVTVHYAKNQTVMDGSQVAGAVADDYKTFLAEEWRSTDPAEDTDVKLRYLLAHELVVDTLFDDLSDAETERDRLLELYSTKRDCYRISVPLDFGADAEIGTTVRLTFPRFGLDDGKLFVVIGRVDNYEDKLVELELWG